MPSRPNPQDGPAFNATRPALQRIHNMTLLDDYAAKMLYPYILGKRAHNIFVERINLKATIQVRPPYDCGGPGDNAWSMYVNNIGNELRRIDLDVEPSIVEWLGNNWVKLARRLDANLLPGRVGAKRSGRPINPSPLPMLVASHNLPAEHVIRGVSSLSVPLAYIPAHGSEFSFRRTEFIYVRGGDHDDDSDKSGSTDEEDEDEQLLLWLGPMRLVKRGCELCCNAVIEQYQDQRLPEDLLADHLVTTRAIKTGESIVYYARLAECRCAIPRITTPSSTLNSAVASSSNTRERIPPDAATVGLLVNPAPNVTGNRPIVLLGNESRGRSTHIPRANEERNESPADSRVGDHHSDDSGSSDSSDSSDSVRITGDTAGAALLAQMTKEKRARLEAEELLAEEKAYRVQAEKDGMKLQEKADRWEKMARKLEREMDDLASSTPPEELSSQIDDLKEKIGTLSESLTESYAAKDSLKKELEKWRELGNNTIRERDSWKTKYIAMKEKTAGLEEDKVDLGEDKRRLRTENDRLRIDYDRLRNDYDRLRADHDRCRGAQGGSKRRVRIQIEGETSPVHPTKSVATGHRNPTTASSNDAKRMRKI